MPDRIANHTIHVGRPNDKGNNETVEVRAGQLFNFTDEELTHLENPDIAAVRLPVNDTVQRTQPAMSAELVPPGTVAGEVAPRVVSPDGGPVSVPVEPVTSGPAAARTTGSAPNSNTGTKPPAAAARSNAKPADDEAL